MKSFWGLIIILIGVWLLGENFSWWNHYNLNYLWHFWPIILILFGISLIVRNLKFGWLLIFISFLVAIGFVTMFLSNDKLLNLIVSNTPTKSSSFSNDLIDGFTKGEVTIDAGAISVEMNNSNSKFIEGTLNSDIFEPSLNVSQNNSTQVANLSVNKNSNLSGIGKSRSNLNVNLTNRIPLDITINSSASTMNLDLSKLILSNFSLNTGASTVTITVGENVIDGAGMVIKSGVSNIIINIPNNLGARIQSSSGLSSHNFQDFKNLGGGTYESSGYSASSKKINLNIESGVSSISIKRLE